MATQPESRSNKSLLEQLPEIVRTGKRQAERIMEGLEARSRVGLQTRELVTLAKDTNWQEFQGLRGRAGSPLPAGASLDQERRARSDAPYHEWFNRLIYGDNLLAMAALLAGDEHTPSLRGTRTMSPGRTGSSCSAACGRIIAATRTTTMIRCISCARRC